MDASTLGFVGGTGPEGRGLALRFALAGLKVMIGSRDKERAIAAVDKISDKAPPGSVVGALNSEVAMRGEIVFIAVPYAGQAPTLQSLEPALTGKLVITVVAPVIFNEGVATTIPVPEGSAALQAATLLPNSRVAAAFHNVAARDLLRPPGSLESDVFVFSDDDRSKSEVADLTRLIPGTRPIDGGGLINARYAEDLTALLMNINRIHKAHASIRITGL